MKYEVCKPVWRRTPEKYIGKDFPEEEFIYRVTDWEAIGICEGSTDAEAMEHANAMFERGRRNGFSFVLRPIGRVH